MKLGLDENGVITSVSLCGIVDGKNFCLDRTSDGSKHEQNKNLLLETFEKSNCYRVSSQTTDITCKKDDMTASSYTNGTISVKSCFSNLHGTFFCH